MLETTPADQSFTEFHRMVHGLLETQAKQSLLLADVIRANGQMVRGQEQIALQVERMMEYKIGFSRLQEEMVRQVAEFSTNLLEITTLMGAQQSKTMELEQFVVNILDAYAGDIRTLKQRLGVLEARNGIEHRDPEADEL
jgi:hypothetical protein